MSSGRRAFRFSLLALAAALSPSLAMGRKRAYSILEAEQAREHGQFSRLLLAYAVQLEDDDGGEDDGDETACVLLAAADSYGQSREPFLMQMPRFQVGPRRFSFSRIVEEWGETTRNCKEPAGVVVGGA